jgi:hypothetical protein
LQYKTLSILTVFFFFICRGNHFQFEPYFSSLFAPGTQI